MIEYTEEYLSAVSIKVCSDFMVSGFIDNIKQSQCPCMDQPGYLLFSWTDNNQMIYISNDQRFRGIMENTDSEVFAHPYKSKEFL